MTKDKKGSIEIQIDDGSIEADYILTAGRISKSFEDEGDPDEIEYSNIKLNCSHDDFFLDVSKLESGIIEQLDEAVYND